MFSTDKKNNKQVQNYIKLNELGYVTKNEKHDFTEHLLPIVFSIYIYIYIYYMKEFYQNKMVLKNKRNYSVN